MTDEAARPISNATKVKLGHCVDQVRQAEALLARQSSLRRRDPAYQALHQALHRLQPAVEEVVRERYEIVRPRLTEDEWRATGFNQRAFDPRRVAVEMTEKEGQDLLAVFEPLLLELPQIIADFHEETRRVRV